MKTKRKEKIVYSTVSLPKPLVEKIKETIKGTGYVSISDFVTDVLRTVLLRKREKLKERKGKERRKEKVFSKEDEERIRARLKGLGYI